MSNNDQTRHKAGARSLGERILTRVGGLLELSAVAKIRIVGVIALVVIGLDFAFRAVVYRMPSFTDNVDWEMEHLVERWELYAVVGWVAVLAVGRFFEDSDRRQLLYALLGLQYFAVTFALFSYAMGGLSFGAGIYAAGVPVIALMLFRARAALPAILTGGVLLLGTTIASAMGSIPYAPIYVAAGVEAGAVEPLWIVISMLQGMPFLLLTLFLAFLLLARWRERDRGIVQVSMADPLTGIANRKNVIDALRAELFSSGPGGYKKDTSIILVDLDHFKKINDAHGHPAGDRALIIVAETLTKEIRTSDIIGRYGGQEFLLVLRRAPLSIAQNVAERCREAIDALYIETAFEDGFELSASFGVGSYRDPESLEAFVERVDKAVIQAKKSGRNAVVASE